MLSSTSMTIFLSFTVLSFCWLKPSICFGYPTFSNTFCCCSQVLLHCCFYLGVPIAFLWFNTSVCVCVDPSFESPILNAVNSIQHPWVSHAFNFFYCIISSNQPNVKSSLWFFSFLKPVDFPRLCSCFSSPCVYFSLLLSTNTLSESLRNQNTNQIEFVLPSYAWNHTAITTTICSS